MAEQWYGCSGPREQVGGAWRAAQRAGGAVLAITAFWLNQISSWRWRLWALSRGRRGRGSSGLGEWGHGWRVVMPVPGELRQSGAVSIP